MMRLSHDSDMLKYIVTEIVHLCIFLFKDTTSLYLYMTGKIFNCLFHPFHENVVNTVTRSTIQKWDIVGEVTCMRDMLE